MTKTTTHKDGRPSAVRAVLADAQPVSAHMAIGPDPGEPLNGVDPGQWVPAISGLPQDCPVMPLGVSGSTGYFIDPNGQLQTFAKPYGKGDILGLFLGDSNYLSWAWPRHDKKGAIDGFAAEKANAALLTACRRKGIWDAVEKVRGRGAWLSASGKLLIHTGDELLLDGKRLPVCEMEGFVYPTRPAIPRPWSEKVKPSDSPARLLLGLFRSWNWERPEIDPVMLLGWIGAAWLGAALPWRPAIFITGDKATGKSTLQKVIKLMFGDALVQAADTSAAGIYQRIGQDCLPVAVDELESESDVRRQKAVLKLARLAASGALMLRGGDRHQGVEFQARSCFLFSSINAPPLEPQDLSRMALLRLKRLPQGQPPPEIEVKSMGLTGRIILRRLIDEWPRFEQTFAAFRGELAEAGMDGRGQDTFGVLLTCADMILNEGWDEDRLRWPVEGDVVAWRELLVAETMAEFEDAQENWLLCLSHLLSVQVEAWRHGTRRTVGQVLWEYFNNADDMSLEKARNLLGQAGLTLTRREDYLRPWLAVPNQNPLTRTLFEGSKWAGDVGAGVWAGALRQGPDDICAAGRARVNGVVSRATLVSLEGLYGSEGIMRNDDES